MANRHPLRNVAIANTEHPVDNRLATSAYVMAGVEAPKTPEGYPVSWKLPIG